MKTAGLHIRDRSRHEGLRVLSVCCILLFAILPLLTLAFHVNGADWQYILVITVFMRLLRTLSSTPWYLL